MVIRRDALRRNAKTVTSAVQVPVIGIIKCSGYGITVLEAADAWKSAGVTMFGVSRPEEAMVLRDAGYTEDILLLSPVSDSVTLFHMAENNIILTVTSLENAEFYSLYTFDRPLRVHIAVDTGMGRFGIRWSDIPQMKRVYSVYGLSVEGIFSHFAKAFEPHYRFTKQQLNRFLGVTEALTADGICVGMRHIANSSAALRFPETRLDAVRIGSALVGCACGDTELQRVCTFHATVLDCKTLQPGDTLGYGSFYTVKTHKKAAIISLGRVDGFGLMTVPERLCLRSAISYLLHILHSWLHPVYVIYKGQKLPLLGRVGNQHTLFDATGTDIRPGDTVQWDGSLMLCRSERRFI